MCLPERRFVIGYIYKKEDCDCRYCRRAEYEENSTPVPEGYLHFLYASSLFLQKYKAHLSLEMGFVSNLSRAKARLYPLFPEFRRKVFIGYRVVEVISQRAERYHAAERSVPAAHSHAVCSAKLVRKIRKKIYLVIAEILVEI